MTMQTILIAALALGALATPAGALAAGDPVQGQKQFIQCKACHSADPAKPDMVGPNLAGVFGTKAGKHRPKFKYSTALKASKLTWDEPTLDRWIADPAKAVPGTNMHFIGVARKPTRDNIIAYLKTTQK